ncbi:hypothetical protein I3271_06970 [Photobacterium leiognathi]|uniref:hypothetical protein n=1 Tax=Photobacterium leiognathi TaxID=553611 RepID=UPI001EE122ED|nr:hypothetical protein [Photobacterium leiognathi]MCG3884427.1 hypothetical protein [Photobacterium leiognathi]
MLILVIAKPFLLDILNYVEHVRKIPLDWRVGKTAKMEIASVIKYKGAYFLIIKLAIVGLIYKIFFYSEGSVEKDGDRFLAVREAYLRRVSRLGVAVLIFAVAAPIYMVAASSYANLKMRKGELATIHALSKTPTQVLAKNYCDKVVSADKRTITATCKFWNPTVLEALKPWLTDESRNKTGVVVFTLHKIGPMKYDMTRSIPSGINGFNSNHAIEPNMRILWANDQWKEDPVLKFK